MSAENTGGTSVTALLTRWRGGDEAALAELLPLVYDELRRIAGAFMRSERPDHTIQATALVHEAFSRLVEMDVAWQDRAHFMSIAARAMRRILVDYARSRASAKRGGKERKVPLDEALQVSAGSEEVFVDLDAALSRLAEIDERKSRVVELRYFGGLTDAEIAEVIGVSVPTVERDLRQAKAWLYRELA